MVNALDAGVDTIIHAIHKEPDGSNLYRPDITERIARQGVFVNATMGGGRDRTLRLEDKSLSEGLTEEEQLELDTVRATGQVRLDHASRMRAEGVKLACGSDSAWGRYVMGRFQSEIDAHVASGMTPMEAIVAATSDSARSCWADETVGSLEPGKQADLLVVDGDPSQDIAALWNVVDVFQNGALVDRGSYA